MRLQSKVHKMCTYVSGTYLETCQKYDGTFLRKYLTAFSLKPFSKKSFIINIWKVSKYVSGSSI